MTKHEAAKIRWICQIYNMRGYGLNAAQWAQFKAFCEAAGLTDEPTPGRRVDGRDPWDVFEERIRTEGQL